MSRRRKRSRSRKAKGALGKKAHDKKLRETIQELRSSSGYGGIAFRKKGWHYDPSKADPTGCVYIERKEEPR